MPFFKKIYLINHMRAMFLFIMNYWVILYVTLDKITAVPMVTAYVN